jgi:Tfp pilus assembly protein PilF
MVASYSHRTWTRNVDWTDNQHLFEAAEQVCPNSAKVHFNLGILRTQQKNFTQSAYHFKRTLEIEPNYCEVAYRRALMHLGQSSYQLGVADLHESLNCIYTRADGATALFKVYQAFINADPANANKYAEQWNAVLKKLEPIIQEEKEGKRPIRQG